MNNIFKFLEYINESSILNILTILLIAGYLIYIYSKKETEEKYLVLKIIGFYLLGGFRTVFSLGSISIIIPIGFFMYLMIFKSKYNRVNYKIKDRAVVIGLVMIYVSLLSNKIYELVEYRDRTATVQSFSINELKDKYEFIKNDLDISKNTYVDSFNIKYSRDKKIISLNCSIADVLKNKLYYINLSDGQCDISVNKVNEHDGYIVYHDNYNGNDLRVESLLDILDKVKFKEYKDAESYIIGYEKNNQYLSEISLYGINLNDYSTTKLPDESLIIGGVSLEYFPMRKNDNGIESIKTSTYLIDYTIDETDLEFNEMAYEGINLTIKNIETNKSKYITDINEVAYIGELLKREDWQDVNFKVNVSPDLFIEDNKGNKFGLCEEDKCFILREINGTKAWYLISTELYDKINYYTFE